MPFTVGQDEAADPAHIRVLGTQAVMAKAAAGRGPDSAVWGIGCHYACGVTCVNHTPAQTLDNPPRFDARAVGGYPASHCYGIGIPPSQTSGLSPYLA